MDFCYNLKLRQADRALTNYYDGYMRQCGLKITQFSILKCLWVLKDPSQRKLEQVLMLNQATLTRNLKPLLTAGYITNRVDGQDRRIRHIELTADGKALYQRALPLWQAAQDSVSAHMGELLTNQLVDVTDNLVAIGVGG